MSEKQRFEITDYGSEYYIEIIDNKKELDKSIDNPTQRLDLVECCGLLNEFELKCYKLEKENEQLKKENEKLTKMLNANYKTNNELVQYIQMLESDNDE